MTKTLFAFATAVTLLGGVARAQTPTIPPPAPGSAAPPRAAAQPPAARRTDRYIEGIGGWTFGDKGSQFFAAEGGFTWKPNLHVFVEGGRVNNAGAAAVREAASIVADGLSRTQSNVTFDAKQPTIFVDGGLRYHLGVSGSRAEPFVLAGAGVSRVKQDVRFMLNGNDVTETLAQLGVVLGSDLSGSFTKAHVVFGGGLAFPVKRGMYLELGYRLMRIFAEDGGININRAGLGFGMRF